MEREKRNDILKKRREGKMGWLNDYKGKGREYAQALIDREEKRRWFIILYIVKCGVNIDLIRGSC
jgi:hypothetical protein